jgi:uncharacterized membrane protein
MPRPSDTFALASLAGAAGLSIAVHGRLPERVATHFDLHGVPDGFMARTPAACVLPAMGLAIWALLRFSPRILPASERARLGARIMPVAAALMAAFVASVHVALLAVALVPGFTIVKPLWLGAGVLYAGLGILMPRVRRNGLLGIRTPWTLASDENWARTHRLAGYTMIGAGLLGALAGTFGGPRGAVLAVVLLVLGKLAPAAYSLLLARREDA